MENVVIRSASLPFGLGLLALALTGGAAFVGAIPWTAAGAAGLVIALLLMAAVTSSTRAAGGFVHLLLAANALLAPIVAMDLVMRSMIGHRLHYRPEVTFLRKWPPLPEVYSYAPRVEFEGESYGDLAAMTGRRELREPRVVTFRTDRDGFRNDPSVADSQIDVVVLGDSFGAGAGVTQRDVFASRLGDRTGLNVLNLSISPAGPWAEFLYLKRAYDRFRWAPKAIVIWALYVANDLEDAYGPVAEESTPWADPSLAMSTVFADFQRRSPIRELAGRVTAGDPAQNANLVVASVDPLTRRPLLFYRPNLNYCDLSPAQVRQDPNFKNLRQTVAAMRDFTEKRDLQLKVMVLPAKEEVYGWVLEGKAPWSVRREPSGFARTIEQLAAESRLPFYDAKGDFFAEGERHFAAGELLWWRDDTHINGAGHAVVADGLARFLATGK